MQIQNVMQDGVKIQKYFGRTLLTRKIHEATLQVLPFPINIPHILFDLRLLALHFSQALFSFEPLAPFSS